MPEGWGRYNRGGGYSKGGRNMYGSIYCQDKFPLLYPKTVEVVFR